MLRPSASYAILAASLTTAAFAQQQPPVFPTLNLPAESRGASILASLGDKLPEVARFYGVTEDELGRTCLRDHDLRANRNGRLYYVCEGLALRGNRAQNAPTAQNGGTQALLTYPASQTFLLHSKPGLTRVVYLDFDGHTTTDGAWNGGATFTSKAYSTDSTLTTFSTAEQANIQEIWRRVSEDFAPWDVDVTTEAPPLESLRKTASNDTAYGIRVVIGGDSRDWYGGSAGGVAYVGSFSWSTDTPIFVFPDQLGYGWPKYVAEATSHETGHSLGLTHDGTSAQVYYAGNNGWAPIMGDSYDATVSQFSKGEYTGANNLQDDLAVIDTHAPRSPDLPGNAIATAALFSGSQVTGIIESRTDADLFRIDVGAGPISFTAAPASPDANLDIILSLYDSQGVLITSANSSGLNAGFATNVLFGTYYVAVEGGGTSTDNGLTRYTDYASIGQYVLSGTYPSNLGSPPVASFTPASTTFTAPRTIAFNSAASYDPEDGPLTYNWAFGDGTFSSEANPSKTYSTAGTYTVSLIVYDATGLSGSTTGTVFAKSAAQTIYVSNTTLTITTSRTKGRQGKAVVTVRDATGAVKSGVTVTGRWSGPLTATSNVVTTTSGTATFTSAYTKNTTAFNFTVTGISLSGAWYDTSRNGVTTISAQ